MVPEGKDHNSQSFKSNYQLMHSDVFKNEKVMDRNKNLNDIKKSNPQALPPAGK